MIGPVVHLDGWAQFTAISFPVTILKGNFDMLKSGQMRYKVRQTMINK